MDARFTVSDIFTRWSSPSLIRHALLHPRRKHLPPLFPLSLASLLVRAFDRLYPPGSRGSCREQASLRSHKSWPMYLIRIGPPLGIRAIINYHRHAILIKNKGSMRFALARFSIANRRVMKDTEYHIMGIFYTLKILPPH